MQLAILLLVILIAVLVAPWLIGVAAATVAIYGIYLVAAVMFAGIATIAALIWFLATDTNKKEKVEEIHGKRKICKYCQVEMASSATYCKNCGESNA